MAAKAEARTTDVRQGSARRCHSLNARSGRRNRFTSEAARSVRDHWSPGVVVANAQY
jgi:hypothetical protein